MKTKTNDETGRHLLDVAALHFAEKGFSGARVDEIALEAGISKSSLYYRFADKQALYDAVLREMAGALLNAALVRTKDAGDAKEKFRCYVHAIADVIFSEPHVAPILLREVANGGVNMSIAAHDAFDELKTHLVGILDLGKRQKIFHDTDPGLLHLIIGGTLNFIGAGVSARDHDSILKCKSKYALFYQEKDAIVNHLCELLLRSLATNSE